MQRLRFFMDLSGNTELLDRPLVAFFASRKATPHDTQLALQWAESICQTDKVVISGFHSPLEKEILSYLLKRHHPVILALGRALYKKIPSLLQTAFDEGNLLFILFRGNTRHSWNSALQRNWGVASLATEIYFTQFDNTSSLGTLHFTLEKYSNKTVYILE
jgi:predicted Rossmann fold nucleotide-binding protein DprA/Smf involved in DNA uptake